MTEGLVNKDYLKVHEAPRTREIFSDEQIGNLLSAIGNHEAKAITLILMRNGDICDRTNLYGKVLNAQGNSKGWKMARSVLFQYCSGSLSPIGLVTKEVIDKSLNTWGYMITEYGKEFGVPLAGLLLEFSERHNIPLNKLFGSTKSRSPTHNIQEDDKEDVEFKKRSPITTLRLLFELLTSPSLPVREVDIEKAIGEEDILGHLSRLAEIGLIQYKATKPNAPYSRYRLSIQIPEELPTTSKKTGKIPTQLIFDILKENPHKYFTSEDIYALFPKEIKDNWKIKILNNHISAVLSHLAKNGYAEKEKFYHKKQSEVNITEDQRMILSELLEIIDKVQDKDEEILKEGREFAERIIIDQGRVSKLLKRTKEASSHANESPSEETQQKLLSLIVSSPEGLTNKEMQNLLEEGYGKRLGIESISALTSSLEQKHLAEVVKEGSIKKFFPRKKHKKSAISIPNEDFLK